MQPRLYVMNCGYVTFDQSLFVPHHPKGTRASAPLPFALLLHPQGNVLIDTGNHPDGVTNPAGCWGGLNKVFTVHVRPEELVVAHLDSLGLTPNDIKYVVNTHLHMDHAGGNQFFPNAQFIVNRLELDTARDPKNEGKGYFSRDWDHPLDYRAVEGEVDLFGDGVVRLIPAPGHTPGIMVAAVRLAGSGTVVLANDVAIKASHVLEDFLPKNTWNYDQAKESLRIVRDFYTAGATIVYGHDGEAWNAIRTAPAFYE